jgi:hypothetical protein
VSEASTARPTPHAYSKRKVCGIAARGTAAHTVSGWLVVVVVVVVVVQRCGRLWLWCLSPSVSRRGPYGRPSQAMPRLGPPTTGESCDEVPAAPRLGQSAAVASAPWRRSLSAHLHPSGRAPPGGKHGSSHAQARRRGRSPATQQSGCYSAAAAHRVQQ